MAEKDNTSAGTDAPTQSDEARAAALSGAPKGTSTATGQALAQADGSEDERIANLEDRGSTVPVAGGDQIKPDYMTEGGDPVGLQAEPAIFVNNGTIPPMMVPSGSGLVPASSVTSDPEEANRRVQENIDEFSKQYRTRPSQEPLTEQQIDSMSGADLRALGLQRGFDMGEQGGTRTTRARFSAQQANATSRTSQTGSRSGATSQGQPSQGTAPAGPAASTSGSGSNPSNAQLGQASQSTAAKGP